MDSEFNLVSELDNPYALAGFVLAILFWAASRTRGVRRSAALFVSFVVLSVSAVLGSLWIAWHASSSSVAPESPSAISQASGGADSTNIAGVQGDVSITVNRVPQDDSPRLRVTYYRMGGLAPYFLVHGLLAPEWQELLGGHQNIVRNIVFEELKYFLNKFSEPIFGGAMFGDFPLEDKFPIQIDGGAGPGVISEYAQRLVPGSVRRDSQNVPTIDETLWRAFLGGAGRFDLFIPDTHAANVVFRTLSWPTNYSFYYNNWYLYHGSWERKIESVLSKIADHSIDSPVLWRYVTEDDFMHYEERYDAFSSMLLSHRVRNFSWTGRFGSYDISTERPLNHRYVSAIRYLTRNGLPKNFMLVTGHTGAHGGWGFSASVRDLELVIAVIENASSNSITVSHAGIRQVVDYKLRLPEETGSLFRDVDQRKELIFSPGVLAPGEMVVIPVRIQFSDDHWMQREVDTDYTGRRDEALDLLLENLHRKGSTPISVFNYRDALFQKQANLFMPERVPDYPERFDYGPAWSIDGVYADGSFEKFQPLEERQFLLYAGFEKGSCPIVFTYQPDSDFWTNEGEILIGAIGSDLKRSEEIVLSEYKGRVMIREIENETSFIDQVRLIVTDIHGNRHAFLSDLPELRYNDDIGVRLDIGDNLELEFDVDKSISSSDEVRLAVTGFYVPMDSIWSSADYDGQ